jgi:hypothetical protein
MVKTFYTMYKYSTTWIAEFMFVKLIAFRGFATLTQNNY